MTATLLPLPATDGFVPCDPDEANRLLIAWGHNLGPSNRPFRSEPWLFLVDGVPYGVAVSASIVSATVGPLNGRTYRRGEVVELARLCAAERWVNRLMLRWWREVGSRRWECWPVKALVAYSQNDRHEGRLYRFDGWTKVADDRGSMGGGAWTRKRYATAAVAGKKTLWMYDAEAAA